jgi:serine/threonine protein phosphatase PrpC
MQTTYNTTIIQWGVAQRKHPGTTESGDQYLVESYDPGGVLVAVVDGLGHGPKAAAVAKQTVAALEGQARDPLTLLFERCHRALRGSRGVVMSLASFSALNGTMTWLGVGNVEGVLIRGSAVASAKDERLILRGGIVGYRLPSLRPITLRVSRGDTLILATDGLRSGFASKPDLSGSPQQIAERIFAQHYRGTDDALILVTRYVGKKDT